MKKDFLIISVFTLLILAVKFFVSFEYTNELWGINLWAFYPVQSRLIFLIIGIAVCIGLFNKHITRGLEFLYNYLYFQKLKKIYLFLILSLLLLPLFYIFRTKTFFLGDGYLLINNVETVTGFRYEDILGYVLPSVLYRLFHPLFNWSSTGVFLFLSITCGFFYLLFSFLISDKLSGRIHIKAFIFFSLLFTGFIQNFFGYVELYAISIVFTLIFVYAGLLVIESENRLYISAAVLSAAICFHPANIILMPAFLYLFYLDNKRKYKQKLLYFSGTFLSLIMPVTLTFILLSLFTDFSFEKLYRSYTESTHLLPLSDKAGTINFSYSMFSLYHLRDFFNKLLLIAPCCIFILPLLFLKKKDNAEIPVKYFHFIQTVLLFSLLFIFVFHFELGAGRDWDLASNAGIPLVLFTAFLLINRTKDTKHTGLIVITFSLICIVPWIGINADYDKSVKRFLYLTEDKSWSPYSKGAAFDELRSFYGKRNEDEKSYEYAKKAVQVVNSPRYMINWAAIAHKTGRLEEALSIYRNIIIMNPDNYDAYVKYTLTLLRTGRYNEALEILDKAEEQLGNAEFYTLEGSLYEKLGKYDKAEKNYSKAIEIAPDKVEIYVKYADFLLNTGKTSEALNILLRIEKKFNNAELYLKIAQIYKDLNNFRQSEYYYKRSLASDPDYLSAYLGYSSLFIKFGKPDGALMLLEQARFRFESPEIYFNQSLILAKLNRYEEAVEKMEKVLEINPGDEKAKFLLNDYKKHLNK